MPTLTVTAKGQVTLRKEVLRHLGVQPGERIDVEMLPDGRIEARAASPSGSIADAFDILKHPNRLRLSLDEIHDLAAEGWAKPG